MLTLYLSFIVTCVSLISCSGITKNVLNVLCLSYDEAIKVSLNAMLLLILYPFYVCWWMQNKAKDFTGTLDSSFFEKCSISHVVENLRRICLNAKDHFKNHK